MPDCKHCGSPCETWPDLYRHIVTNKSAHPKWQVRWAEEKICNADFLNKKVEKFQQRIPLSESDIAAKEQAQRVLSGHEDDILVLCPNCNSKRFERLPVEYIESPTAWRKHGKIAITCESCNRKSIRIVKKQYV